METDPSQTRPRRLRISTRRDLARNCREVDLYRPTQRPWTYLRAFKQPSAFETEECLLCRPTPMVAGLAAVCEVRDELWQTSFANLYPDFSYSGTKDQGWISCSLHAGIVPLGTVPMKVARSVPFPAKPRRFSTLPRTSNVPNSSNVKKVDTLTNVPAVHDVFQKVATRGSRPADHQSADVRSSTSGYAS